MPALHFKPLEEKGIYFSRFQNRLTSHTCRSSAWTFDMSLYLRVLSVDYLTISPLTHLLAHLSISVSIIYTLRLQYVIYLPLACLTLVVTKVQLVSGQRWPCHGQTWRPDATDKNADLRFDWRLRRPRWILRLHPASRSQLQGNAGKKGDLPRRCFGAAEPWPVTFLPGGTDQGRGVAWFQSLRCRFDFVPFLILHARPRHTGATQGRNPCSKLLRRFGGASSTTPCAKATAIALATRPDGGGLSRHCNASGSHSQLRCQRRSHRQPWQVRCARLDQLVSLCCQGDFLCRKLQCTIQPRFASSVFAA